MHQWRVRVCAVLIGSAIWAALGLGCDDEDEPLDQLNEVADCSKICVKYSQCLTDLDELICTRDCERALDKSPTVRQAAERCEECIEGRTCKEVQDANCWAGCPVAATGR